MTNFAQPVSMECTEEQYNRDLKDGLEKLGYKMNIAWGNNMFYIGTNFDYQNYVGGTILYSSIYERNRHFIDHYNPSLFLAIAGMREGEDVHVGEWVICINDLDGYFTKDKLYENVEIDKRWLGFVNDKEHLHSWSTRELKDYFRKATLSELITHFTKKDMIYTLEDLRDGKVACVNDGTIDELRAVLKHCFPGQETEAKGNAALYQKSSIRKDWYDSEATDLPTQSVKLFHSQLPKEHEFKFGDEVLVFNDEGTKKQIAYYIGQSGGRFIVADRGCYRSIKDKGRGDIYTRTEIYTYPEPIKITRSEIAEWKGTDHFEIVD